MNKRNAMRAAVLSAASAAALLGSASLLAHGGPSGEVDDQMMMRQMEQVREANRAMHKAPPDRRDKALAEHRHGMQHMMEMMRMMHHGDGKGGMGDMPGGGKDGMGNMSGDGMGSGRGGMGMGMNDAPGPDQMRDMRRRMDRMEDMMGEMLDHMDMAERRGR